MREKFIEKKLVEAVKKRDGMAPKFVSPSLNGMIVDGELTGSKLTMNKVFKNFMNVGYSANDAVMFTSSNAARLMGLSDRGSLEVGKRADIVVMDKSCDIIKVYKA